MSRVVEYGLLSASDSQQLAAKVNERVAEGWQPHGSPFGRPGALFQAVVLSAKAAKRIRRTSED
jgi:hypothetical protein